MLEIVDHGSVREIRMARPPANALSPDLIAALDAALAEAPAAGAKAIVLSGVPGLFSAGLDVPLLLTLDRPEIEVAWGQFLCLVCSLTTSAVPIAAAITGHATAGGCVLPLYCDARFMARGRIGKDGTFREFSIGVNEVAVGLPMPSVIVPALARIVGERQAERMCVTAELLPASEAYRIGLVDELLPLEETVGRAVAWCRALVELPPQALARTRAQTRAGLIAAVEAARAVDYRVFVDDWFGEEAQSALRALGERLAKKS
ncbi:MAG TPA: enoyl-CoA hydratase/isomerase family protein [Thermoanaerobaculia bacterium]|jgi:enoyl-CoA hydratase/carnithine racemase|nr:enoyl-CoA hydratase/isomerase family protein [Thermoanaerobaculia bacterium]